MNLPAAELIASRRGSLCAAGSGVVAADIEAVDVIRTDQQFVGVYAAIPTVGAVGGMDSGLST
jgi:hypothetical protein